MGKKRLGIGFLGAGFISRFHIQSLLGVRDVDVIGVFSKTKQILFKKDGLPKYFNSIAVRGNIKNFENFDRFLQTYHLTSLPSHQR